MANWTSISDSEFPWERDALAFIRNGLPASSPLQVWSNFEFMAEGGAIYEVDALVVGPWGAFIVEIKSLPGVISSQAGSWIWRDGTTYKTRDNPLPLANRKCKALKALLERQAAFKRSKVQVPFIEPLIFCSDENNILQLSGPQANGVCLRDRADGAVPGIIGAISRRDAPGLRSFQRPPVTKDQIRAFVTGVEQISLDPVQKVRKAGDYVLDALFHDSPLGTCQEWLGHHVRIKSGPRLIRVYLEGMQGETERSTLRRAAEREFQILERMEHPGILRVDTLTETESGPALVFRWQEGAQRLDHYLAGLEQPLAADSALEILRQITEAIAYAHRKKVIHRGLSPQAIIVIPGEAGSVPTVQISSWNLGFIDGGTSSGVTRTRFSTSLHAGQLGDFNGLFRDLATRTESTVLFPTHRWITAEMEALRIRNRLEFIDLTDRLAQIEAHPATRVPLPVIAKPRAAGTPKVRAAIHAGNGLTWSQVTIELAGNQTIRLTAPGQDGSHAFPKSQQLGPEHPLGILMTLAAKGEWRNPPLSSPEYERVSKAFQRLQTLLRTLVPLPGRPFRKSDGAFVPIFQIRIYPKLLAP